MVYPELGIPDAPREGDDETRDLKSYVAIAIHSWWVFVVVMAAAGGITYAVGSSRNEIYTSTAKVLVQSAQVPGALSLADIEANRRFAQDFEDLLDTRPVLELAASRTETSSGSLATRIDSSTVRSIVSITVTDENPTKAADTANVVAAAAIELVQRRQLAQLAQLRASLSLFGLERDAALIAAQASTFSTISVVEEAIPSSSPEGPAIARDVLLAIIAGFVVSLMIAALREYLDDRIRSPEQLRNLTGVQNLSALPAIGSVINFRRGDHEGPLIIVDKPARILTEAYQFLQTNLRFAALDTSGLKSILVTSTSPGEGKTTTAVNLATSFARESDASVLLIDTDLRRPSLHRIFDLGARKGLTDLLLGGATFEEVAAPTAIRGLRVIPTGPLPPDPPMLLRSGRMQAVVAELKERADFVFFDSPPVLAVTDPMLVGSLVDGVVLVVDSGHARRAGVKLAVQMLRKASPRMIGVVFNKVAIRGQGRYGGYNYYEYEADGAGANGSRSRFIPRFLSRLRFRKSKASEATDE